MFEAASHLQTVSALTNDDESFVPFVGAIFEVEQVDTASCPPGSAGRSTDSEGPVRIRGRLAARHVFRVFFVFVPSRSS